MAENIYEIEGRYRKAMRLFAALDPKLSVETVENFSAVDWLQLAQIARVKNLPSIKTIKIVIEAVRTRNNVPKFEGDPFAGFPSASAS